MVLEIIRQGFAALEPLAQLGVGEIARDDHRPGEFEPGADRMAGQAFEDFWHRPRQVDLDGGDAEAPLVNLRQVLRGFCSSASRNTPSRVIFPRAWRSAEHD